MPTSSEMAASAPGRCTFTATDSVSPVAASTIVPRYTWPRLALAIGGASPRFSARDPDAPSSWSKMRRANASSNGGTASWSVRSSITYGAGRRSWRELRTWPSLTYVGPKDTSRSLSCAARRASVSAFLLSLGSSPRIFLSSHRDAPNAPSRDPERRPRRRSVSGRRLKYS